MSDLKFKVGDRVQCVGDRMDNNLDVLGLVGTILHSEDTKHQQYFIDFPDLYDGVASRWHSAGPFTLSNHRSGWWLSEEDLVLV
jgi:hypothetical protein